MAPLKHKRKRRLQIIEDSPELEKSTHVKDKPKRRLRMTEYSPEPENLVHAIDSPATNTRGSLRRRSIGTSPILGNVAGPLEESVGKKKRGPTKMKTIATSSDGRLEVKFNALGQPIGGASVALSSFLGPLMREIVPVTISDWRKITPGMKEVLWKSVQVCFLYLIDFFYFN